ncbi:hypothetical protein V1264_015534 [Littorina saxatilis]|uniref:Uncharacterized protein n=1 Tax=Littorina saxatilis TaxID=31220 RepID=A0AAN9GI43_9CAEN
MRTFILLAVVVAVASAAIAPRPTRPDKAPTPDRDAPSRGDRRRGGGSGAGGGSGSGASGYGSSYYAPPPPPPPHKGDGLDKLDKLFSRVDAVSDQLKTVSEQVVALEARQAVQVRLFDRLVTVTLEALANTDENQNDRLTQLEAFLTALEDEFKNELEPAVDNLQHLNMANKAERLAIDTLLNEETDLDIGQAGRIARLVSITADFQDRLRQVRLAERERKR